MDNFLNQANGDPVLAAQLSQLEAERLALFELFKEQNVYAFPTRVKRTPVNAMFSLSLRPDEQIKRVQAILPEIEHLITNMRGEELDVRLNRKPLFVDVPHVQPEAILWDPDRNFIPHHMLGGRGWSFKGGVDQWVNLNKEPHTLVAGITGSGKSVMVLNLVLSLCMGTSPEDLALVLVDLKNEDLVPLKRLPHVVDFAGDPEDAITAMDQVYGQLEQRRDAVGKPKFRIVTVIDELAQLPGPAKETLNRVTALGRSMWINVVAATQHPNGDTLGGVSGKVNFGARFTGLVSDAGAASNAAGRPKTGAESLPGDGAFIRTGGPHVTRLQSFLIEEDEVDVIVDQACQRWAGRTVPSMARALASKPIRIPERAGVTFSDIPGGPVLEEYFEEHYDGNGGLVSGKLNGAIRLLFGEEARTGGSKYDEQRAAVLNELQEWLVVA